MDFLSQSDEILSVSEFTKRFKMLVKTRVPELWLRGEISNLKTYSSGHIYFTLKDAGASVSAVLFKGYSRLLSFPLKEGMKLLAYGEIDVYEARGSYQLVVKAAMPDGAGDLAARFDQLKKKLADEGLFDKSRKRAIPRLPRNIAVITSPDGAAIRDFCRILQRRGWRGDVCVFPARVQGAEAAAEIAAGVRAAQASPLGFDLVVVMRGGGSLEDLWCFNEEIVARELAACKIPTISAVGHEIDFTLSDFAADLRAETPSAAAELISSNFIELLGGAERAFDLIKAALDAKMGAFAVSLKRAGDVLRLNSPQVKIQTLSMRLDEVGERVKNSAARLLAAKSADVEKCGRLLEMSGVARKLPMLKDRVDSLEKRLAACSVQSVLARGFAVVKTTGGAVVSDAKNLKSGDDIVLQMRDGETPARVK